MNPKTVVILIIVLGLAGLAYVFTQPDRNMNTPGGSDETAGSKNVELPLLSKDTLGNGLRLIAFDSGLHGTLLELERIDGTWWVTKPNRFKADSKMIDELLTALGTLVGRPTENGPSGLVPDGPGLVLANGLQVTQLYFNNRLGAGRAAVTVVRDGVNTDYNATDTLQDIFDELKIDRYYAKTFDPPLMPEIGRIDIKTPNGSSSLFQKAGRWWIERQVGEERALETGLPGYPGVQALFDLFEADLVQKQSDTPANGMASYGLHDPLISVRFIPQGKDPGEAYEVHVGTAADPDDKTRYVSNGTLGQATHPVFTMATEVALAFGQDATVFRDPRIIATPGPLIASIGLTSNGVVTDTIELFTDKPPALSRFIGEPEPIPPARAAKLLKSLTDARAQGYVRLEPDSFEGRVMAVITPRLGGEVELITIYPDLASVADNPTVLIRRDFDQIALRVPKDAVAGLLDPSKLVLKDNE